MTDAPDTQALAHLWSAISHGLMAAEALVTEVLGARPDDQEPPLDAPGTEVTAWMDSVVEWERNRTNLLARHGILPGVMLHQRARLEAQIREHLSLQPDFDDGCDDWDAEIRQTIAEALESPEWVARAWAAGR